MEAGSVLVVALRMLNLQTSVADVADRFNLMYMNRNDIESLCLQKENTLLNQYFGNLVKEASIDCPETIGEYDMELPLRIESEYRNFLQELWSGIAPNDTRTIDDLLDKKELREKITADDREGLSIAYQNAQYQTLWERITKSNHKDVTYYKGLLEEYTRELLFCMRHDFLEEV